MSYYLRKTSYYNAPDGEQLMEKLDCLSKRAFFAGLLLGAQDCLYHTDTKNALQTLNCLGYWTVPLVGMSVTFGAVTFASTRLRKKDDCWNYAIGALCCSPILHAWKKSAPTTVWGTVLLIGLATGFRYKEYYGVKFMPEPKHIYGQYMYDMTLTKDVSKDWYPQNKPMY